MLNCHADQEKLDAIIEDHETRRAQVTSLQDRARQRYESAEEKRQLATQRNHEFEREPIQRLAELTRRECEELGLDYDMIRAAARDREMAVQLQAQAQQRAKEFRSLTALLPKLQEYAGRLGVVGVR